MRRAVLVRTCIIERVVTCVLATVCVTIACAETLWKRPENEEVNTRYDKEGRNKGSEQERGKETRKGKERNEGNTERREERKRKIDRIK